MLICSRRCSNAFHGALRPRKPRIHLVIMSAATLFTPSTCSIEYVNCDKYSAHRFTFRILCLPKLASSTRGRTTSSGGQ